MPAKRTTADSATNDGDELLSVRRAAELLDVSRYTMRALISEGTIPACEVRGLVRVRRADVRAYIASQFAS